MQPARETGRHLIERALDLLGRVGKDHALGLGIEQAPAALGQAVVEENIGGSGHLKSQSAASAWDKSIAHMGA